MKRFIHLRNPRYNEAAAVRIMDEVLSHIPDNKHVVVLVQQDLKVLEHSPPGVYYVTKKLPVNANVLFSDVKHYFYRYVVLNKKKRIQTFLIPRIPIT